MYEVQCESQGREHTPLGGLGTVHFQKEKFGLGLWPVACGLRGAGQADLLRRGFSPER